MLLLVFLAGWLGHAERASLICTNVGAAQTQSVHGPAGKAAVLKVSSEDDHSKNTHLCMADYQLLITHSEGDPLAVDLSTSDAEWGRSLSISLDGFSQDGTRIFGVIGEGGITPTEQLFDYNSIDGTVRLFDMEKQRGHYSPTKCPTTASVIGTTESGEVVVQLSANNHCFPGGPWLFRLREEQLKRLAPGTPVRKLYSEAP